MSFLKISMAQNGWILEEVITGGFNKTHVFQHNDSSLNEAEAFLELLNTVRDLCGPQDSRYSEHRVVVKIEPGDKFETTES